MIRGLCSNHLSYSHGKRFIDYKKANVSVPEDFRKLSFKLLSKPRITAGIMLRPYVYFRWLRGPYRLLLDRDILGLKYIAYSPGEGLLVADGNLKISVYVTREALKIPDEYSLTVFRVYRCLP